MTKDNLLELLLMMMMMVRMRMMTMMMMNGFCGVVWLTEGSRFALFQAETIVRDPHHRKSPARLEKRDIENNNTQMEISLPANVDMAAIIQICYILFVLIKYSRYIEIFKS